MTRSKQPVKKFRSGSIKKVHKYDQCQTPFYALDPLIPYLRNEWIMWESACGDGNIMSKLEIEGFKVIGSDLLYGQNFFEYKPNEWHCQITNPPYSTKFQWIEHSYRLNKPFALLLPLETLGAASGQKWFKQYSVEIILLNRRVNFHMPNMGYNGGGAHFPVAWFTWGLEIGAPLTFATIIQYPDEQGTMNL